MVFGAVAFADWLNWVASLTSQQVRLDACRIEALSTPGLVSVTATLVRDRRVNEALVPDRDRTDRLRGRRSLPQRRRHWSTPVCSARATAGCGLPRPRARYGRVRDRSKSAIRADEPASPRASPGAVLPESLLRGHLVCEVELDQAARRFPVTISLSRIELANADINLPATALGLGVPKLAPLGLTGDVLLHIAEPVDRTQAQCRATPRCNGATPDRRSRRSRLWATMNCASTAKAPTVHAYPAHPSGSASTRRQGILDERRTIPYSSPQRALPPQHQQQLAPLLRLIAVERGEGSFELRLN